MTTPVGTFATTPLSSASRAALIAYVDRVGYERAGERFRVSHRQVANLLKGGTVTPAVAERITKAIAAIDPLDLKDEEAVERRATPRARAQLHLVTPACSCCGADASGGPSTCWACKNAIPASDDPRWPLWDAALTRSPMLCLAWSKAKVRNLGWWREARAADVPLRVEDFARRNGDVDATYRRGSERLKTRNA